MFPPKPEFLVISPPKTGTTWLADNFRCHPELFVPAIKEVKYFSSLHRVLDRDWYLRHFDPAGMKKAGDVSPSYAALPVPMIRRIREQLPDIKLIFLMRDPIGRAWSHARHVHRYRELTFATETAEGACPWRRVVSDDWSLTCGDYLGHLQRWTSVFPKSNFFVGFYESIEAEPLEFLARIFGFLGVDPHASMDHAPVHERLLPGVPEEMSPSLEAYLRGLLAPRSIELASFLETHFGLHTPAEWQTTLGPGTREELPTPKAFALSADNDFITSIGDREEDFPTAYRDILRDYREHNLVYYRGRLLALDQTRDTSMIPGAENAEVDRLLAEGACLTAPTVEALKDAVVDRLFDRLRAYTKTRIDSLEAEIRAARRANDSTNAHLAALAAIVHGGTFTQRVVRRVRRVARRASAWAMSGLFAS